MNEQMVIPGMESMMLPKAKQKAKLDIRREMAELQSRVLWLELELTLLRIQIESGEDHANS